MFLTWRKQVCPFYFIRFNTYNPFFFALKCISFVPLFESAVVCAALLKKTFETFETTFEKRKIKVANRSRKPQSSENVETSGDSEASVTETCPILIAPKTRSCNSCLKPFSKPLMSYLNLKAQSGERIEVSEANGVLETHLTLNVRKTRSYNSCLKSSGDVLEALKPLDNRQSHKTLKTRSYKSSPNTLYKKLSYNTLLTCKSITNTPTINMKIYHPVQNLSLIRLFFRKNFRTFARLCLKRSGDVESNPGPEADTAGQAHRSQTNPIDATVMVTSYNVRGLNDEKKLRHLINRLYKEDKGKNFDSFVCLQETFIAETGKIPYLWRGNLHLTPGTGSSCGCLTLTSPHLNILHAVDVASRAHVVVCQKASDKTTYIVANIYGPNPNNSTKIDFYDRIFEIVSELKERFNCANVVMAGDFNLVFTPGETKNRLYSAQERRVADFVKDQMNSIDVRDSWENNSRFTWRRPNSNIFSTIDRILYSGETIELVTINEDWTYSFSDHAAVKASFKIKAKKHLQRSKITRLDPSLAQSSHYRNLVEQGYNALMSTVPNDWNPHLKLEFAKMSIRTVVERLQAERKRLETGEENSLNEELDTAIKNLSEGGHSGERDLIDYVEELRAKKQAMIDEKGARLAEKLGTKWYNEGEKSSKYFLRLLNRSMPDNFEFLIGEDGAIISDPKEIEDTIVTFYKKLYEDSNEFRTNEDDFFNNIDPVTDDVDTNIAAPLTTNELLETLRTCADSSPGPDGIPYSYLKLLWPSFGTLLCEAWSFSLTQNCLPPSHKNSFL